MRFDFLGGGKEPLRATTLGLQKFLFTLTGDKERIKDVNKELYEIFVSKTAYKDGEKPHQTLGTFWRYGLHPTLGMAYNYTEGVDPVGKEYGAKQVVRDFALPLPMREIYETANYDTPEKQTKGEFMTRLLTTMTGTCLLYTSDAADEAYDV